MWISVCKQASLGRSLTPWGSQLQRTAPTVDPEVTSVLTLWFSFVLSQLECPWLCGGILPVTVYLKGTSRSKLQTKCRFRFVQCVYFFLRVLEEVGNLELAVSCGVIR